MSTLPGVAQLRRRLSGAYYGWRIIASLFVVNALHDGTYYLGFSIFFLPISRDFKLSHMATSLPFTLNKILPALLGPVVGILIDRQGPGRILLASGLVSGIGWVVLSRTHSYTAFLVVMVTVLSIGMMGWVTCSTTAVNVWFRRRRSSAMAVAFTGFTAGGAIIPPSLAFGVAHLDWRTTMLIMGMVVWAIVIPLATTIRRSPESMGLHPDGVAPEPAPETPPTDTAPSSAPTPLEYEATVGQALRSPPFWMLTVSTGLSGMVSTAFALHMVAIMTTKGLEETTAGYLVGLLSVFMAPLVLIMGWMGDRWPKQRIAGVGHVVRSLAFLVLLVWTDVATWQMILILVLLSPSEAIWSLGYALLADMYGRRNIATLRGVMGSSVSLWTIGMPVAAGWVFDQTGGYGWLLGPFALMTLASGLLLLFMPGPDRVSRDTAAAGENAGQEAPVSDEKGTS